ncbi:hypothetical protein SPRG_14286 [Saprolegnia parasitica CBS 223.65]|uniref:F-box domain-containing protein n=1 Tax=Saprolegnia parasitica (strain CBS 223.65) TaxID=695850 RepID=A0A067C129_SAPPC|nr:hypothetical protein SPRG_14286 [Saprolegnia parasitica CBS 223.65]KDO20527.1 hypothetical protein SPRG_14286 [Saprolegnia parasitica CBS 223.65]|eukprot:XP_012208788.1 hypothetical protein SPRG_14286 [Saprolegnia parasitica CBS 223.65]
MAKRVCHAQRSVLDLDVVVLNLAQCTASPTDVAAFLRSLPPALLTPPLAALLEALRRARPRGEVFPSLLASIDDVWPVPRLNRMCTELIDNVVAAMPVFVAVGMDGLGFDPWPADRGNFDLSYSAFITKCAAKLNAPSSCAFCTNIESIGLRHDTQVLEAVTSPAHRVRDIRLSLYHETPENLVDGLRILARWLVSGHARRLELASYAVEYDAGLADALASSPTLTSLYLNASSGVLRQLVAHGQPLRHLCVLQLLLTTLGEAQAIFPLVDVSKLTKLRLFCPRHEAITFLLAALPRMTALEELEVKNGNVGVLETAVEWPEHSAIRNIWVFGAAFAGDIFRALLLWAARSRRLERIELLHCRTMNLNLQSVGDAFRRCIVAGVRYIGLRECNINTQGATLLAAALQGDHAPAPMEIELVFNSFRYEGTMALKDALRSCTSITITVWSTKKKFKAYSNQLVAPSDGVTVDVSQDSKIVLCSPAPTLLSRP